MEDIHQLITDAENRRPLVLIVDDISKNIQLLSTILSRKNYQIAFANSGEKALEFLEKRTPELILLDIMMPGMDGLEVCRRIKEDQYTKEIPVIFLTGKTQPEDIKKGFQAGAVDYVVKPFNSEELVARVRTHIEFKRAQDMKDSLISYFQGSLSRLKDIEELLPEEIEGDNTIDRIANFVHRQIDVK
ncbi:response regulator [Limisalsivibrio acetivorans]|uniref:response regulator n=1 Tax=Limisalsivibrio acetivorans TaxID=1304888 RepID=UPI0003B6204A|nr:response regulator [Limisalsivibrio acetivorans]